MRDIQSGSSCPGFAGNFDVLFSSFESVLALASPVKHACPGCHVRTLRCVSSHGPYLKKLPETVSYLSWFWSSVRVALPLPRWCFKISQGSF